MKKLIICASLCIGFVSCSNECVTCTIESPAGPIGGEHCDDGTNYTDQNGDIISFDEFVMQQEASGYTCK